MMCKLWDLDYWESGEWQTVREKLRDLRKNDILVCPARDNLFAPLRLLERGDVRVVIIGQDPYPNPAYATGLAFSIPKDERIFPPSLANIFKELEDDLHTGRPSSGDLSRWVKQGVFLWNAIPSCTAWRSASHHWDEWWPLTEEIVKRLDAQGVVFILLGGLARQCDRFISQSPVISTSHPSPLGAKWGFTGSRIFSRCNAELVKLSKEPIDWRL